ncbi:MAG: 16S rRNA (guanine(527)-N(7))-methyltransferase RsmG [Bdellovibrionales bacterium]|nr:16S rRNA (guanine(527)-N(7))-methyltransferase RsmG [Bdellovibrionales bacterium]
MNWRISKWFPSMEAEVLEKLKLYHSELLHFNKSINLISSKTEESADELHIADAILGGQLILNDAKHNNIYDIGSGNGVPGIVLAIMDRQKKIFLLDSDSRKCEFLKLMVKRLHLNNAEVINTQFEKISEDSIECAVSRGFASLGKTLIVARQKMKKGATYYNFKSDSWFREVADIPSQVSMHYTPQLLGDYSLPSSNAKLSIIKVTKR